MALWHIALVASTTQLGSKKTRYLLQVSSILVPYGETLGSHSIFGISAVVLDAATLLLLCDRGAVYVASVATWRHGSYIEETGR